MFFEIMTSQCRQIRTMINQKVFVGIMDLETEGVWRFVTDDTMFVPNQGNTLYPRSVNNYDGLQHFGLVYNRKKIDDARKINAGCEIENKKLLHCSQQFSLELCLLLSQLCLKKIKFIYIDLFPSF